MLEKLAHRQEHLALQARAVEVLHAFFVLGVELQHQHLGQVGQHVRAQRAHHIGQRVAQLAKAQFLGVVFADVEAGLEDFDERPIAEMAAERQRPALQPPHAGTDGLAAQFSAEAALARTRFAADHQHPAAALAQLGHRLRRLAQFAFPPHHRCGHAQAAREQIAGMGGKRAQQFEGGNRGCDAFQGPGAQCSELEKRLPDGMNALADAHRARRGRALQTCGNVGGVADGGVVHAQVVADAAHHHRPGVDADAGHHAVQQAVRFGRGRLQALLDRQCTQQGAAHMVFVRQGRAEQSHEAVTQELVDRAFEPVHFGHGQVEERVQRIVHALGPEALRQLRAVGQVTEQDADLFALAFQRRAGGEDLLRQVRRRVGARLRLRVWPQPRAAGVAETRFQAVFMATRCTQHRALLLARFWFV